MSRFSMVADDNRDAELLEELEMREKVQAGIDRLLTQASIIFQILVGEKEFVQTYMCNLIEEMHLLSFISKRLIVVDVMTRCSADQIANFDTYKYSAHPTFEKKITAYTRSAEKPNPQLSKCRAWDVALNVILKVEALDNATARLPNTRLLFRDYNILKHLWDRYVRENMDLDEMTGIPMVFEYVEVPNPVFNYETQMEPKVMDVHGNLVPWKSDNPTTLSYMSMEQLGPHVRYLQELMIHTKRRSRTFDLETSFKVFDQLICRCLQLHRFGVVHNCIEPKNIHFGRSVMFNVVYLSNYSRSMILDSKERKSVDVFMGGDPRYMSQFRARGAPYYPIQDIEAAFYTLLSMIVSNLPWDIHLIKNDILRTLESKNNTEAEDIESPSKVREVKSNFWKSAGGINRVLADVRYQSLGPDAAHANLATEVIKDLYSKLRDNLQSMEAQRDANHPATNLMSTQSSEYQFYIELRRTVLMFFRFESVSASLCTVTYQKKLEAIARDEQEPRPAWNISNWCFNVVQMNAPGNTRLSMLPVESVARTAD